MSKKIRQLLSIVTVCICMSSVAFGDVQTETELKSEAYNYAQIYNGNVRINALRFNNNEVEEPLLLYKGNYYLPMTSKVRENLGIQSGMSEMGNIAFTLGVPQIDGSIEYLSSDVKYPNQVEVIPYEKDINIGDMLMRQEATFTPAIVYNNTIYLPLNHQIVKEALELEVKFSEDQELTIIKDMDKMMRGTLSSVTTHERKNFIEATERTLESRKDEIITLGKKYELEDQVQYSLESEAGEEIYVAFADGSWMVASLPLEGLGTVMHVYGDSGDKYVGQYANGTYEGIGRYSDKDGNVTAINEFEAVHEDVLYSDVTVDYLDYTPTLAILVEFSDERIFGSDESWYQKLFADDANSLRGYYQEVTHGQINLIPAIESNRTINDGIVKITLDMKHPNSGEEIADTDDLLTSIMAELEDQIDMQIYDKNDNGVIDKNELTLISILAGYEASDETPADYSQFRAHHKFSDISMESVDGIGILNMIFVSEKEYFDGRSDLSTMGVFAHELAHQLGLPDLYDTDGSSKGLGPFSLMAEGSGNYVRGERPGETIAYFDPWSLIKLKAITPEIVSETGEYVLNSAASGKYNVIRINTQNANEYFLLENRQVAGRDLGLKNALTQSGGILIYHIDESVINAKYSSNTINDDEGHKGIDIEEARERSSGALLDSTEHSQRLSPFFTAKGVSEFNNTSTPRSRLNDGSESGISIKVLTDGSTSNIMITIE